MIFNISNSTIIGKLKYFHIEYRMLSNLILEQIYFIFENEDISRLKG